MLQKLKGGAIPREMMAVGCDVTRVVVRRVVGSKAVVAPLLGLCAVALAVVAAVFPSVVKANVVIPNTIDVDAFGGTIMTAVATPLLSVVVLAVTILFLVAMKRLLFSGARKIAR